MNGDGNPFFGDCNGNGFGGMDCWEDSGTNTRNGSLRWKYEFAMQAIRIRQHRLGVFEGLCCTDPADLRCRVIQARVKL